MGNAITITNATDNFALAAAHAQTSTIVGARLRFNKGRYLVGGGAGEPLPAESLFEARDIQGAWMKFSNGVIVDQRIGWPLPRRDELDDPDPEHWSLGMDGKPADPWSNQRYLYLIDPQTGAEYTFITSSRGGHSAVEQLARQIYNKRAKAPGAIPVIKLEVGYLQSARYGSVPAPKFTVVRWVVPAPLSAAIDDDIPF